MKYRLLEIDEWNRLSELVDKAFIPPPEASMAAVAEDDSGKLTGVLFLQLAMHMEPLVLKSPYVNFSRLHDMLYNTIQENKGLQLYAFSESEVIDGMARHVGMKELPYRVFKQEIR